MKSFDPAGPAGAVRHLKAVIQYVEAASHANGKMAKSENQEVADKFAKNALGIQASLEAPEIDWAMSNLEQAINDGVVFSGSDDVAGLKETIAALRKEHGINEVRPLRPRAEVLREKPRGWN